MPPGTHASFNCCTRKPVGPGAVSEGKARRQRVTKSGAMSGVERLKGLGCGITFGAKPFGK